MVLLNRLRSDHPLRLYQPSLDGVYSDQALMVPLGVFPLWLQTVTAKILASCMLLGLLALAYRLHIHFVAKKWQEQLQSRLAARDRMAWELHDLLLQSTEGLILQMHSAIHQLPADAPQRAALNAALDRASELAYEGRERIEGVREGRWLPAELGHLLDKAAREMIRGTAIRFELAVQGPVRELRPYVREELYRIGYEALCDACRHSGASWVTVSLQYGDLDLLLLICDDGRGIEPETLQPLATGGHSGLVRMRERARRINAEMHIQPGEGGGTQVEIRINAVTAYVP